MPTVKFWQKIARFWIFLSYIITTVRFMFSNVAIRPTVYKTGVETHWEFLTLYGKDYLQALLLHIIHTDNCIDHVKILSQAVAYGDQFLCVLALLPPSHHNYIQWCSCYYVVLKVS